MKKYDVYGIGNALVDMVFTVDDDFLDVMGIRKGFMTLIDRYKHDEILAHLTLQKRASGGSAANAMIMLSHLGGKGFYSCKVADDEAGHFYIRDLKSAGIDTNLKDDALTEGVTGKCLVMITPDAERTMNTYLGATETFSTEELDEGALANSEYIYIEGYLVAQKTGQNAALEAVGMARRHGVKTSLTFSDPTMVEMFRTGMEEIIGDGLDLVFCNEREALAFARTDDLGKACERLKGVANSFAITRGERGALVYGGSDFIEISPRKVGAVDTVGAGDMFAGAFLFGITHGHSFALAGELANLAASTVVTQFGPRLSEEQAKAILEDFKKGVSDG